MAILLMGDPNDYRKPHMTLMHAPSLELIVQDDSSTPVIDLKETENKINATSMFIFGDDTECILVKGKKKTQIRIRTGMKSGFTADFIVFGIITFSLF